MPCSQPPTIRKISDKTSIIFLLFSILFSPHSFSQDVSLGLLIAASRDRDIYLDLLDAFNTRHPEITINYIATDDAGYKTQLDDWLSNKHVDITFSPAGNLLCRLARENKIASLDHVWQANNWDDSFSTHVKKAVSCNGKIYGLPYGYYYWGFFYKKSVFRQLKLTPPETWEALLKTSQILKQNGITPFAIGTKNRWPAAGWFDYFNLRLNGLDFHQQLIAGDIPFTSKSVRPIFELWKQLIDNKYFIKGHRVMDWKQAMPFIYRGHAGMTLAGAYILNQLPEEIRQDIGFFRFPRLNDNMPFYENVPIETFVLNSHSTENQHAIALLEMAGQGDTQHWLAKALGCLSVYEKSNGKALPLVQSGVDAVNSAAGFAQYFDRDARPDMTEPALEVFHQFMQDGDIDKAIVQLEMQRINGKPDVP